MPYRDDRSALESRRDDLRRELEELRPRTESLREVVRAQESAERELAATEARLAEIEARRASLLDDVRVASPCKASWDAMKGDERVRFCDRCEKNVYDLSAMTRDEATRLLVEREESLCVRLYRRDDGTVLTADCPVGVRRKRVRLALYGAAGAGAFAVATGCAVNMMVMGDVGPPPQRQAVMGKMVRMADSYVPQPLRADPERGLVFVYRQEPQTGQPGVQWKLWADGRAVRVVDGAGAPQEGPLTTEGKAAAQMILSLGATLRAEGTGAVPAYADSAVPRSYELFGAGTRVASDGDRQRLFELAGRLRMARDAR